MHTDASRSAPLTGRTALVTGGGSGIGKGIAMRLASDGALVTICGRSEERLRAAAADIEATVGRSVEVVSADVTMEDDVVEAVRVARSRTGSLDVVVTSAGGSPHLAPILITDTASFRATIELNLIGTLHGIKHGARAMAETGGGSIIAISSVSAIRSTRHFSAYCASKAALDSLVEVAADELGPLGVRVNSIRPGLVETDFADPVMTTDAVREDFLDQMPIRRVGTPAEIASVASFLAGPESTWITGQHLGVDGGHSVRRGADFTPFAIALHGPQEDWSRIGA